MTLFNSWDNMPPMIANHWRFALCSLDEVQTTFSGDPGQYLSSREGTTWAAIRDAKYRRDWLVGRLLVKELYDSLDAHLLPSSSKSERFQRYEIISRNTAGRGIRPQLNVDGIASERTISISHAGDMVFVGIGLSPRILFGLDLTPLNAVSPVVVRSFFSESEKQLIAECHNQCFAERLWCAKEASYKALCRTESFIPRLFRLASTGGDDFACTYRFRNEQRQSLVFTGQCKSVVFAIAVVPGTFLLKTISELSRHTGAVSCIS